MNRSRNVTWVIAMLVVLVAIQRAAAQELPPVPKADKVRVYYFGNSLTGTTIPELHPALGKSAGKEWVWDLMAVAGGQLWQYRDQFQLGAKLERVDDYTIDSEIVKQAPYAAGKFLRNEWDAIVLQPFGTCMKLVADSMWGKEYGRERDFGDLAAAKYLIDLAIKKNPETRILIYQDYPGMTHLMDVRTQLNRTGKELNHRQMEVLRRSLDYPRHWFRIYNPSEPNWNCGSGSRSYEWLLMDKLIDAYPDLWENGQLRLIPVGDVYYALDLKMRAGLVPGVENIGQYYTDGLHNRAGMASYTSSATFYTMLFGARPHTLDYQVSNDPDSFGKDWGHGKDEHNDTGVLLHITPEAAQVVNDTIWEVVNTHPYCQMKGKGSREALEEYEASIPAPVPVRVYEVGRAAAWSAMPPWQCALDRTAGKHSAWAPLLMVEPHVQNWGAAWLDEALKNNEMPYNYIYIAASKGLHETNHTRALHDALCVQVAEPIDAEVAGFVSVAGFFFSKHPDGFMLAFLPWPSIPEAAKIETKLKLEPWQVIPEEKMATIRKEFDYAAAWEAREEAVCTAAGLRAFQDRLRNQSPQVAARTRIIPAGELLARLDAKLKKGFLPSCKGVGEFYKDDLMLRTGLPRYAIAALRFAVVHRAHPKDLDAAFFNDPSSYYPDSLDPAKKRGRGREYVVVRDEDYDNGPHFPITARGKELVDETVWDIVND